ncbi:MAG: ABC transporter ATP-binding protein [Syntrophomonadaceae bacterium]
MRNMLYAFLVMITLESVIAVFIIRVLTGNMRSFLIISAAYVSVAAFLVYWIVSLLHSAHALDEKGFVICLGKYFKTVVPWKMIERIETVSIPVTRKEILGHSLYRKEENLYCLAKNQSVYRIALNSPLLVKAVSEDNPKNKQGMVTAIFINVDDPEAFDKALKTYIANETIPQEPKAQDKAPEHNPSNIRLLPIPIDTRTGEPRLELRSLSYQYGDYKAVDSLSLTVHNGEIFALLGPNGAGKSTTLKMLTGLLKPLTGHILLDGQDIWMRGNEFIRKQIGYVPDQPILYTKLTAKEHLYYSGKLLGLEETVLMDRIDYLLELFDLTPYREQMIETYSQGMQRKVSMCLALLNDPQLLIVDELTNAYDAKTIAVIKKIFKERKAMGKTVLFSGHVMAVTEELADYIVILQKGTSQAAGTMAELTAKYGGSNLEDLFLELTDAQVNG